MASIRCMYCGAEIQDDAETCSACGAISHFRKRGNSAQRRKKFILFFIVLTVVCVFLALWLPR